MAQQPIFIQLPSPPMQAIYNTIQQVKGAKISFFIIGETGVGKEGSHDIFTKVVPGVTNLLLPLTVVDSPQSSCRVNSLGMR